jgi:beta-N-acetylhexosaminidase
MIDLKAKPFNLSDADVRWVSDTLAGLSEAEKIGQLFCMIAMDADEAHLSDMLKKIPFGGIMYRPMPARTAVEATRFLQTASKVPVLIAANLEKGGTGIVQEGTTIGANLLIAATDDEGMAAKLGTACGREGGAVGANWAFAPVIDIDYNFRNPITNTRTFGSDPDRVKRMGVAYTKAVQAQGLAASIKHFPGDGVDERDQHLVTSINDLPCEAWDATYGAVYKACIDAGALTVMVGHIAQPNYSRRLDPSLRDTDILPASLAGELLNGLLRDRLGFNGLIVTDASTMAGMIAQLPRSQAVPLSIAAGCDMFLFTRSIDEDLAFMRAGIAGGVVSKRRLDDAVTRILALKAALKLHVRKADGTLIPSLDNAQKVLGCAEHRAWAKEAAEKAATLVKEEPGILPLTPGKYPRVLFYEIEAQQGYAYSVRAGVAEAFRKLLEKEGFKTDVFEPAKAFEGRVKPTTDITGNYDLIVYLANMSTKSNQTVVRIEWAQPMGANVPVFMSQVPTVFVSVENPYHLLDVPRVRTFVNGYCATDQMLQAIVDKLTGKSAFAGVNPVDPFCGRWDTKLS